MQLLITPVDVWLFRNGRSFTAGDDHHAAGYFPPLPSVMQGVLRSHHLVVKGIDLTNQQQIKNEVGDAIDFKDLQLRGPIIMREDTRYYPSPADAVTMDKDDCIIKTLSPQKPPKDVQTNASPPLLLWDTNDPKKGNGNLWLSEAELHKYLVGDEAQALEGKYLFQIETRFGIQRDNKSRATVKGQLYEVGYTRPCQDVGLWLAATGLGSWPREGLLRIGGEGRGGYFKRLDGNDPHPFTDTSQALEGQFKLYLATPTFFDGGWQPINGDWSQFFTGPVLLQAAAVGRYLSIGGYDWAGGRHKPAYRYVPAGSVYYFRAKNGPVKLKQNWLCHPTPDGAPIGQIGFGQVINSSWQSANSH